VFIWESDGKYLFAKSNFTKFVNRNVKILSLMDVACLEDAQLIFLILHAFVCKFGRVDAVHGKKIYRQMYGKLDKLTKHLIKKLCKIQFWKKLFAIGFPYKHCNF